MDCDCVGHSRKLQVRDALKVSDSKMSDNLPVVLLRAPALPPKHTCSYLIRHHFQLLNNVLVRPWVQIWDSVS